MSVGLTEEQIRSYRGLSEMDSTLFALLAYRGWQQRDILRAAVGNVAWAMFTGKTLYERITDDTLFVSGAFVPLPLAHLVDAFYGTFVWFGKRRHMLSQKPLTSVSACKFPLPFRRKLLRRSSMSH